ncbi:MAG: hypothetical protein ACLPV4_10795 [Solirubrobacteraceae bacterium]
MDDAKRRRRRGSYVCPIKDLSTQALEKILALRLFRLHPIWVMRGRRPDAKVGAIMPTI